jgi:hypothetical protein
VRFQVLTTSMKMIVLWDVSPIILAETVRRFTGDYYFDNHGDSSQRYKFRKKAAMASSLS